MRPIRALIVALLLAIILMPTARAAQSTVQFRVFAHTTIRLADIAWTGKQFLYVENTTNKVAAAGPSGLPTTPFATMPRQVEETRCRISPGAHGFAAGDIYCHSPDNKIYRISPDGKQVVVFATLPHAPRSDGALTFDTVGAFGNALIAATGRSGGSTASGGTAFAIDSAGKVRQIGSYHNPGGADEIAIAPASFGSASGQLLIAVDAGKTGSLVAMDAHGQSRTVTQLSDGPNPITVLTPGQTPAASAAQPGVYVTDTLSRNVFFAPAAELNPYSGDVLVGSELRGLFWAIRSSGSGFTAIKIPTSLTGGKYNFEGAVYIAG
ncbi:MAG: hypothetical protein JWO59_1970 [Chloroflexi bacterium]|nr:hypothetical protein [Chloroflexota bacterium]